MSRVDGSARGAQTSEATGEPDGRSRGWRRFDKLLRTTFIIIPIGVLGNVAFSLLVTEREILASIAQLPRGYLLAAMVLGIVPWFTNALRLEIWTRFLGHRLSFADAFRITLATDLGAAVSPTAVGGGLFKWGLLVQRGVSPGAAASLTTLTPFEDGVFFAIAIPIAILLTASWDDPIIGQIAGELGDGATGAIVAGGAIAICTLLGVRWAVGGTFGRRAQVQSRRLLRRVRRSFRTGWLDAKQVYRLIRQDGKALFALSLSLTAIQWIARYSIISLLVAFLGAPVRPVLFWLLQWVVFTLAAFIPTPGAAGGAEAAFFLIYSSFIPSEIMGLVTAGWRFFTFYLLLALAGIVYFAMNFSRR